MKVAKKPKSQKRVSVKLTLPKTIHWKILGSLIKELWDIPFSEGLHCVDQPAKCEEIIAQMKFAVRQRSVDLLTEVIPLFQPRCMLEVIGERIENASAFFAFYQIGSFLKKFPFTGKDTRMPALKKFIEADRSCKLFNDENYKSLIALSEGHPRFLGVVDEIRHDILNLLGEEPNWSDVIEHAAHGPGVSLSSQYRKGKTTDYFKWSILPYSLTENTLSLAKSAISTDPQWIGALDNWYRKTYAIPIGRPISMSHFWQSVLKPVDGSRTTTVPKTSEIDRTIAIEPLLNVYFQLGVDRILRRKLLRGWGYDLNTQERNQVLAKEGSVNNDLTTVDLSMASDLISLKICELVLPAGWFGLMWDLRCPETDILGHTHPLAKMSSMGNGFTFALESLIFAALVRVSVRRTKSERKTAVFGDDIVIPTTAYSYLKDLISLCGFKVNTDKSYSSGPFRESCGKDYFLGYDVRPVFLKRRLTTIPDLFYVHNALYALQADCPWQWDVSLSETLKLIRKWLPREILRKYYGPLSESLDTHLFSSKKIARNGFGQRYYWVIKTRPRVFNSKTLFFFRKLMCRPKPVRAMDRRLLPIGDRIRALFQLDEAPLLKWDVRHRLATGNAFDVTKRDRVLLCSAKVTIP